MEESKDDGKRSFEPTQEECKARMGARKQEKTRAPVKYDKKEKHAKGNVTGASAPSLPKSKAVRFKPEPMVEELKEFAFSAPPEAAASYYKAGPVERYVWQNCLFHEPKKSAMKQTTGQLSKVPRKLRPTSLNISSGGLPIRSPNLAESVLARRKTPSMSSKVSSTMSSVQPKLTDPSNPSKASMGLLKHSGTTQLASVKNVASALPPVRLPKVTAAGIRSLEALKASTKLPRIPPKDSGVNLPALSSSLKSQRIGLANPPTELPPIKKPPEKPIKKSPTWPPLIFDIQFPPTLPKHSSKKPSEDSSATIPSGIMQPKDSGMVQLTSSGKMSLKEHDTMLLESAKENLRTLKIPSPVSSEGARKEVNPVNFAEADPETLQKCIDAQVEDKDNAVPVVYHELYNLKLLPYSMCIRQLMISDKSARVYDLLQRGYLKEYKCIKWTGADISTIFNISDYVSDFTVITELNIQGMARRMRLHMIASVTYPDDFDAAILRPLRVQAMGSIMACKLALDDGWAINIGGGFNHYSVNKSVGHGGLHVYDDVLICLAVVSKLPQVNKILVVNLDAYQRLKYGFTNVTTKTISCPVDIIDIYTQKIHPFAHLPPCFTEHLREDYVKSPDESAAQVSYTEHSTSTYIKGCITKFTREMFNLYKGECSLPSLCIYIAGTYALKEYSLTSMSLTRQHVVERDQEVFELVHTVYKIPITILLGGGYCPYDAEAAAESFSNLCKIGIPLLRRRVSKEEAEK